MTAAPAPPVSAEAYRRRIIVGWLVFGCLGIPGVLLILWLGAPSDPCLPGATDCGPDPWTVARIGLSLAAAANAGMVWAGFWEFKLRGFKVAAPPGLGGTDQIALDLR